MKGSIRMFVPFGVVIRTVACPSQVMDVPLRSAMCSISSVNVNQVRILSDAEADTADTAVATGDEGSPVGSDAGVPGVAAFGGCGAQTFAELLHRIRRGQPDNILHALVAELAWNAHAQRTAETDGQIDVVHAPREQRLRM